jgi:hypothetical protein
MARRFSPSIQCKPARAASINASRRTFRHCNPKVIDAVNRERAFADTAGKVTAGSRTAPMATASKAIDDATAPSEYFIPKVANLPGRIKMVRVALGAKDNVARCGHDAKRKHAPRRPIATNAWLLPATLRRAHMFVAWTERSNDGRMDG